MDAFLENCVQTSKSAIWTKKHNQLFWRPNVESDCAPVAPVRFCVGPGEIFRMCESIKI